MKVMKRTTKTALREFPDKTMAEVWKFLGVKEQEVEAASQHASHFGDYEESMGDDEWERLLYLYEFEIKQLERMLDWDCSNWLVKSKLISS